MELNYWGIDEELFRVENLPVKKAGNKFNKIAELMSRPLHDIFPKKTSNKFFFEHLEDNRLDFEQEFKEGSLKFKDDDFYIQTIKELIEVRYGPEKSLSTWIGRIYGSDPNHMQEYCLYEGEMNECEAYHGVGRALSSVKYQYGNFKDNKLHGRAKQI